MDTKYSVRWMVASSFWGRLFCILSDFPDSVRPFMNESTLQASAGVDLNCQTEWILIWSVRIPGKGGMTRVCPMALGYGLPPCNNNDMECDMFLVHMTAEEYALPYHEEDFME